MINRGTQQHGYVLVDALVALALSGIVLVATQISVATLADLHRRLNAAAQDRSTVLRARLALEGALDRAGLSRKAKENSVLSAEHLLDLSQNKAMSMGLERVHLEFRASGGPRLLADFAEDPGRSRVMLEGMDNLKMQIFPGGHYPLAKRSSFEWYWPDVLVLHRGSKNQIGTRLIVSIPVFDDPRCTSAPFEQRCLQK